jgi:hypothetical protein
LDIKNSSFGKCSYESYKKIKKFLFFFIRQMPRFSILKIAEVHQKMVSTTLGLVLSLVKVLSSFKKKEITKKGSFEELY